MTYNFIETNEDQPYLIPPSIRDWVPEDDFVWFMIDTIRNLDLSPFLNRYRADGRGHPAYHPRVMLTLLVYAYSQGVRSSRRIERLCECDLRYRAIVGDFVPDHSTIARFREENLDCFRSLFAEVLRLCDRCDVLRPGIVALDGTKLSANASLASNRTRDSLASAIAKIVEEARLADESEDREYGSDRGDKLPEGMRTSEERLRRLKSCLSRLEAERSAERDALANRLEERESREAATGEKIRGRKPGKSKPPKERKANTTDPDSRIMKTRSGYVQGYNAQAVVTADQVILAASVTEEENDVRQLGPMLEMARGNLMATRAHVGLGVVLADAGYGIERKYRELSAQCKELIVAVRKDWKQRKELKEAPAPRGRIPQGLGPRERMERKLLTKRGMKLYKKRACIVEPVFGQIKRCINGGSVSGRGIEFARGEWNLTCATHNMLKLWRMLGKKLGGGVAKRRMMGGGAFNPA
jgi:transposase